MELRKSCEALVESAEDMDDFLGIQDDNNKAKALKRQIEEDRNKALKVNEAEEKAHLNELEIHLTKFQFSRKVITHRSPLTARKTAFPTHRVSEGSSAR